MQIRICKGAALRGPAGIGDENGGGNDMTIREKIDNKKVLIWGYGLEGKSAKRFIETHCAPARLEVFEGKQSDLDEDAYDVIIKSPGIPTDHFNDKYTAATDLFLSEFAPQTIGITGTKGKSTTSSLLYHILKECSGRPVFLVGNIGVPCLDIYDDITPDSIIVFEMSCHQLEHAYYSPHVAVMLNIYEDHLDRYGTKERYFEAKKNITLKQSAGDHFIVGDQVPHIKTDAKVWIIPFMGGPRFDMAIKGSHNQINAFFAYVIAKDLYGCDDAALRASIAGFTGLRHRLEYIGNVDGIDFYDDSISTIPEATIAAAKSVPNVHTLLIGGMDRHIDYDVLVGFIREHGELDYIFMYESGYRIYEDVKQYPNCMAVADLKAAVAEAKSRTPVGKACILSPAAASYGYFKNFEERGDVFAKLALGNS